MIQAHTDPQKNFYLFQDFISDSYKEHSSKRPTCMSLSPISSFTDHSLEVNEYVLIIHTIPSFQMHKTEI